MQSLLEWCAGALGAEPDGDLVLEPVAGDSTASKRLDEARLAPYYRQRNSGLPTVVLAMGSCKER